MTMTFHEVWNAFSGNRCETCGGHKPKQYAFCIGCYSTLPHELKRKLWKRFGEGFEEAYIAAKEWLEKDRAETNRLLGREEEVL